MVGGGQCSSVIEVILTLLGDNRGAPSGWRIIHSNNNNNNNNTRQHINLNKTYEDHDGWLFPRNVASVLTSTHIC